MDSQIELRNLFDKLRSWREESQREFSNIIVNHSSSINQGINSLIEEVCNLKEKLLIITSERNDLLETVDNLSGQNQELIAKLRTVQLLRNPEENYDLDAKDGHCLKVETRDKYLGRPRKKKEGGKEEGYVEYGDFTELPEEKDCFEDSSSDEWADADANNIAPQHEDLIEERTKNDDMIRNFHEKFSFLREHFYKFKAAKTRNGPNGTRCVSLSFTCVPCGKGISCSYSSYSNLRRHMDRKHDYLVKEYDSLWARNRGKRHHNDPAADGASASKSPKVQIGNYF